MYYLFYSWLFFMSPQDFLHPEVCLLMCDLATGGGGRGPQILCAAQHQLAIHTGYDRWMDT